jgi:glycerol transport system ATP-binding protein
VAAATKRGAQITLGDSVQWDVPSKLRDVPDGAITVALRPHHVRAAGGRGVPVSGPVVISEISGSESVIHFGLAGATWVSLAHGVRSHPVGEPATFALDVEHCLYFDGDGRRLAA